MLGAVNAVAAQSIECLEIVGASAVRQVRIVEANNNCSSDFINLLLADPRTHLEAFYLLVSSPYATDAIFLNVYEKYRTGQFRFAPAILDDLITNLSGAVAACSGSFRCPDWNRYIVPALQAGGLFQCPPIPDLDSRRLLEIVPYADYGCVESIASALGPILDATAIARLSDVSTRHTVAWSRRNGMRLLGRLVEYERTHPTASELVEAAEGKAKAAAIDRLENEHEPVVLHDAIWILDSMFFPSFDLQAQLEKLVINPANDSSLRFRAVSAAVRLIQAKASALDGRDAGVIAAFLESDDVWVRAQAAFFCEYFPDQLLEPEVRKFLIDHLNTAWTKESEFSARVYLARALDRFDNTNSRVTAVKDDYETTHLPNSYRDGAVSIRSSMSFAELIRLAARLAGNAAQFSQMMGTEFSQPVPGDSNPELAVVVFGSEDLFREYMAAFHNSTSELGGLYIEKTGTLYTYQRKATDDIFSLDHLIDHEQGHYLQGRYIYPGSWEESGYHAEPKGWADEGMAEFIAEGGLALEPARFLQSTHLASICATSSPRSLSSLLHQRSGYDDAGIFDYDNAWALVHYLMTERKSAALSLYGSMRAGTYREEDFASIVGASSIDEIETDWHRVTKFWCANLPQPHPTR